MRTRKGFTIVELVVVIAVIAILAAVLIPSFSGIVEKTEKSTALKLAEAAYKEARAQALEDYRNDPSAENQLKAVEVNGFTFVISQDGSEDSIFRYPTDNSFKYEIKIENKKVSLGETLLTYNPNEDTYENNTPATDIKLFRSEMTLTVGQSEMLFAAVTPAYAKATTVEWEVVDPNGAIEFNNGYIKAVSQGTAEICAKIMTENNNYAFSDTCIVTVNPVSVNFVTLDKLNITLDISKTETATLTATAKPENAEAVNSVAWESSNEDVAIVSNGIVMPVGLGSAVIKATVGGKFASCGVTVNGIKFIDTPDEMTVGQKHVMDFEIFPVGAEVTWESSDSSAVSIDANGVVTALRETSQPVTITATVNGYSEEHEITVVMQPEKRDLEIEFKSDDTTPIIVPLRHGQDIKLIPSNLPADLPIDWVVTSGEGIVAIVGNVVKPVKEGEATLRATATITILVPADGELVERKIEYKADCEIEVLPYSVTVNATNATVMREGNNGEYNITVNSGYELNKGETFNIQVLPKEGYVITGFTVSGSTVDVNPVQFDYVEMQINNVTGDIIINVETTPKAEGITVDGIDIPVKTNDEHRVIGLYAKEEGKNALYVYSTNKIDGVKVYGCSVGDTRMVEILNCGGYDDDYIWINFALVDKDYVCIEIEFNSAEEESKAKLAVTYDVPPLRSASQNG